MKSVVAALILWTGTTVSIADWESGIAAYEAGNHAAAFAEFQRLAAQGDAAAQYNLGVMFHHGEGVPADLRQAHRWYRRAAEQGYVDSQNNLGMMYTKAEGVSRDYLEAVRWYRHAARQGHPMAQNNLGVMYARGHGVPHDYVEAYAWYTLAAQGAAYEPAISNREKLRRLMGPDEISAAQMLAMRLLEQIQPISRN